MQISLPHGVLLLAVTTVAQGFCFFDKVHTVVSPQGEISHHCMYKGLELTEGSKVKTPAPDCIECTCSTSGLSCCGYGIHAGVFAPPEGCKVIANGCDPVIVKSDDETKDCFSGKTVVKQ